MRYQVYQTVEDRDNADFVEEHGPFPCDDVEAWMGCGYYFWESFINNAHWWGKKYSGGYIICQSEYIKDDEKCFNLVDNPDHCQELEDCIMQLDKEGLYNPKTTTICRVIEYLRKIKVFDYEATRASGVNSRRAGDDFDRRINFKPGHKAYLDIRPQIQVCFYNKSALNLTGYKIVHPLEYVSGCGV